MAALQLVLLAKADAAIYKCVDAEGKVMFTDRACPEDSAADEIDVENTTWVEPTPGLYKPRPKKKPSAEQKPITATSDQKKEKPEPEDTDKADEEKEEKDFKTIFFDQYFYNENHKPRPVHPIAPIEPRQPVKKVR